MEYHPLAELAPLDFFGAFQDGFYHENGTGAPLCIT